MEQPVIVRAGVGRRLAALLGEPGGAHAHPPHAHAHGAHGAEAAAQNGIQSPHAPSHQRTTLVVDVSGLLDEPARPPGGCGVASAPPGGDHQVVVDVGVLRQLSIHSGAPVLVSTVVAAADGRGRCTRSCVAHAIAVAHSSGTRTPGAHDDNTHSPSGSAHEGGSDSQATPHPTARLSPLLAHNLGLPTWLAPCLRPPPHLR
jgi:hypothetical protein